MEQLGPIVVLVLLVIAIIILRAIIHIVPQYQRLVVFSFGRFQGMYGPGLVIIAPPPIQTVAQTIDLREFVVEIPQQTCITQDNAPISIDFLIYQRIMEDQAKESFLAACRCASISWRTTAVTRSCPAG